MLPIQINWPGSFSYQAADNAFFLLPFSPYHNSWNVLSRRIYNYNMKINVFIDEETNRSTLQASVLDNEMLQ